MNSRMSNIDSYVALNKIFLKFVGLYPLKPIRHTMFILCAWLSAAPALYNLTLGRKLFINSYDEMMEASSIVLPTCLITLRDIVWFHHRGTSYMIDFFFNDYWRCAISSGNPAFLYKFAKKAKYCTIIYAVVIFSTMLTSLSLPFLFAIMGIFTNERNQRALDLPFLNYPQFCYESPYFEIVYITQILTSVSCSTIMLGMDTIIVTTMLHTCGYFDIISEKLKMCEFHSKVNLRWPNQQFTEIVQHHQLTLRFSKGIESLFNLILLVQALISSVIVCFIGILINSSSNIADAVYQTNWFEAPYRVRADLRFIVLRAQKTSYLTAGKFSVLRLGTFTTILNKSISYFMILRRFRY